MNSTATDAIIGALDAFRIELPTWGFANTGTRFGKYLQPAAAATTAEKLSDAGHVHAITGICPTVSMHVQWDFPRGLEDAGEVESLAARAGVVPGAMSPNLFQDQEYKFGSFGNPDPGVRARALDHCRASVSIAQRLDTAIGQVMTAMPRFLAQSSAYGVRRADTSERWESQTRPPARP